MELSKYIGQQIRTYREQRGWSIDQLAEKLGTTRATVNRYELGVRKANQDILFQLADIFQVPVDDFFPSRSTNVHHNDVVYPLHANGNATRIPIIGTIACGDPITADENIDGYIEEFFQSNKPNGTLFALRCKGHSMEPTIPDGALAIIHEQPEVEDGEIAAVLVDDDNEATLKRVKHQGNLVMLMPDNKKYDPIILNKDNPGRIIGKVIRYSVNL